MFFYVFVFCECFFFKWKAEHGVLAGVDGGKVRVGIGDGYGRLVLFAGAGVMGVVI